MQHFSHGSAPNDSILAVEINWATVGSLAFEKSTLDPLFFTPSACLDIETSGGFLSFFSVSSRFAALIAIIPCRHLVSYDSSSPLN